MGIGYTVRIHYTCEGKLVDCIDVSVSVSDIEYMCLPLNNFNLNILFYCSSIMLLLTLHVFITHLMAKYLSF